MNLMVIVKMLTHVILILLLCSEALGSDCRRGLSISTPKWMEALSGSCLQIPCEFTPNPTSTQPFDNLRPVYGIWIKQDHDFASHPENTVFDSRQTNNKYPMKIIGNLREKNCTTEFSKVTTDYTDRYFLRIENSGYKATAACDPLQITVKDHPWSPSIEISGELKETESVTITCSALTPCPPSPPKLTWNLQLNPPSVIQRDENGPFTTKIQQKLTLSDSDDGLQIKCSAEYPVTTGHKTSENTTTLRVKYSPKNTWASVSPSCPLSAGELVTLSCSSRAQPPVHLFTWFKDTSEGLLPVHTGASYSFNFSNDTQGQYHCEANNTLGKQNSAAVHVTPEDGGISAYNTAQTCGIILLCISLLIIECATCSTKRRQKKEEADYVNCVIESHSP